MRGASTIAAGVVDVVVVEVDATVVLDVEVDDETVATVELVDVVATDDVLAATVELVEDATVLDDDEDEDDDDVVAAAGVTAALAADAGPVPTLFVAVTLNVYDVPLLSPASEQPSAPDVHVHDAPPGVAVTVYPVIDRPPSDAGALQVTATLESPAVAATFNGAVGSLKNCETRMTFSGENMFELVAWLHTAIVVPVGPTAISASSEVKVPDETSTGVDQAEFSKRAV